jgi:hypothetical protein
MHFVWNIKGEPNLYANAMGLFDMGRHSGLHQWILLCCKFLRRPIGAPLRGLVPRVHITEPSCWIALNKQQEEALIVPTTP